MIKKFSNKQFASQKYLERYLANKGAEYSEFWADRLWNPYSDAHTQYLFKELEINTFDEVVNFLIFVEYRMGDRLMKTTANEQFDLVMEYNYGLKR